MVANIRKNRRGGMTLLELVIASSMLAVTLTSIAVVMRTGRMAWEAHEGDYVRIEAAHATLRHIVRRIRQADAVTAITDPTDNSGSLTVTMNNGDTETWDHAGTIVNYGINDTTPSDMLATNIVGLRFAGYFADGVTQTNMPDDVQCVRIDVTVQLPRETGGTRVLRSWVWVRSF